MQQIESLLDVAGRYDAVVLDQWGVLHDGTRPYPGAGAAVEALAAAGHRLAVLSNSGKRSDANRARIAAMGFPVHLIELVMTSGEALWRDMAGGRVLARAPFLVADDPRNAELWAEGLPVAPAAAVEWADAVIVMGLDEDRADAARAAIRLGVERGLPVICSNPDLGSPRAGGRVALSPGALAREAEAAGAHVVWYGKPHRPVFDACARALDADRLLMVGDSPAHDVAGAKAAGWDAALVSGGLHAARLSGHGAAAARTLCDEEGVPHADYLIGTLA